MKLFHLNSAAFICSYLEVNIVMCAQFCAMNAIIKIDRNWRKYVKYRFDFQCDHAIRNYRTANIIQCFLFIWKKVICIILGQLEDKWRRGARKREVKRRDEEEDMVGAAWGGEKLGTTLMNWRIKGGRGEQYIPQSIFWYWS